MCSRLCGLVHLLLLPAIRVLSLKPLQAYLRGILDVPFLATMPTLLKLTQGIAFLSRDFVISLQELSHCFFS